jgi:hypothetical protein
MRTVLLGLALALPSIALATSCGDDAGGASGSGTGGGDGSGGAPVDPQIEALCGRYVEAVCTVLARCAGDQITYEECADDNACDRALDADADQVERCEEQLDDIDCDGFLTAFQGFCEGAVTFPDDGSGGAGGASAAQSTSQSASQSASQSTGGEPTCESSHTCVNDVCECTTPGKEGDTCTDDDLCTEECEVCTP